MITAVTIGGALDAAIGRAERDEGPLPTRLCVVGDGPVRRPGDRLRQRRRRDVRARAAARAPTSRSRPGPRTRSPRSCAGCWPSPRPTRRWSSTPSLRPEGRQGPLVRTLAAYRAYYERWSLAWEAQALLRAEPAAGDRELGRRFTALADEYRYPAGGIDEASVREIRRLKARMEAERMPRGADPALHLKLGPGGLSDVEWVVQLLQLTHAHDVPGLRTTQTLAALAAAAAGGPGRRRGRGRAGRLVAAGHPDPQRGGAGPRPCLRRAARPSRPSWPRWPASWATRRTPARTWSRTTGGPRAAPAP